MQQYYKGDITPEPNTIFVFGSNTQGRHGKGAAKVALEQFGAVYGEPNGRHGNSYAIVTKDLTKKSHPSIPKESIIKDIKVLYMYAMLKPRLKFKVAYRNTAEKSLNGYTGFDMMDMFRKAGSIPDNIIFSEEWQPYI